MLHHVALLPLPLVDGKCPSENHRKLFPKLIIFGGGGSKCPKNGSDSAQLSREKTLEILSCKQKTAKKRFVEGGKEVKYLNHLRSGRGNNKKTGKGKLKMTKVNQNVSGPNRAMPPQCAMRFESHTPKSLATRKRFFTSDAKTP